MNNLIEIVEFRNQNLNNLQKITENLLQPQKNQLQKSHDLQLSLEKQINQSNKLEKLRENKEIEILETIYSEILSSDQQIQLELFDQVIRLMIIIDKNCHENIFGEVQEQKENEKNSVHFNKILQLFTNFQKSTNFLSEYQFSTLQSYINTENQSEILKENTIKDYIEEIIIYQRNQLKKQVEITENIIEKLQKNDEANLDIDHWEYNYKHELSPKYKLISNISSIQNQNIHSKGKNHKLSCQFPSQKYQNQFFISPISKKPQTSSNLLEDRTNIGSRAAVTRQKQNSMALGNNTTQNINNNPEEDNFSQYCQNFQNQQELVKKGIQNNNQILSDILELDNGKNNYDIILLQYLAKRHKQSQQYHSSLISEQGIQLMINAQFTKNQYIKSSIGKYFTRYQNDVKELNKKSYLISLELQEKQQQKKQKRKISLQKKDYINQKRVTRTAQTKRLLVRNCTSAHNKQRGKQNSLLQNQNQIQNQNQSQFYYEQGTTNITPTCYNNTIQEGKNCNKYVKIKVKQTNFTDREKLQTFIKNVQENHEIKSISTNHLHSTFENNDVKTEFQQFQELQYQNQQQNNQNLHYLQDIRQKSRKASVSDSVQDQFVERDSFENYNFYQKPFEMEDEENTNLYEQIMENRSNLVDYYGTITEGISNNPIEQTTTSNGVKHRFSCRKVSSDNEQEQEDYAHLNNNYFYSNSHNHQNQTGKNFHTNNSNSIKAEKSNSHLQHRNVLYNKNQKKNPQFMLQNKEETVTELEISQKKEKTPVKNSQIHYYMEKIQSLHHQNNNNSQNKSNNNHKNIPYYYSFSNQQKIKKSSTNSEQTNKKQFNQQLIQFDNNEGVTLFTNQQKMPQQKQPNPQKKVIKEHEQQQQQQYIQHVSFQQKKQQGIQSNLLSSNQNILSQLSNNKTISTYGNHSGALQTQKQVKQIKQIKQMKNKPNTLHFKKPSNQTDQKELKKPRVNQNYLIKSSYQKQRENSNKIQKNYTTTYNNNHSNNNHHNNSQNTLNTSNIFHKNNTLNPEEQQQYPQFQTIPNPQNISTFNNNIEANSQEPIQEQQQKSYINKTANQKQRNLSGQRYSSNKHGSKNYRINVQSPNLVANATNIHDIMNTVPDESYALSPAKNASMIQMTQSNLNNLNQYTLYGNKNNSKNIKKIYLQQQPLHLPSANTSNINGQNSMNPKLKQKKQLIIQSQNSPNINQGSFTYQQQYDQQNNNNRFYK